MIFIYYFGNFQNVLINLCRKLFSSTIVVAVVSIVPVVSDVHQAQYHSDTKIIEAI